MTRRSPALLLAAALAMSAPISMLAPSTAHAQAAAIDLKQIDDQYENHRHEPGVNKQVEGQLEAAIKQQGEKYEYVWRLARSYWWDADGMEDKGDNAAMETFAKKGWDLGNKAVQLQPNGVEGNFWLAANLGQYSLAVGVLRALANGLESKFNDPLDKAIKLNALFADAGPLRTKGSYYLNLPWPKRDLAKSISLLSQSISKAPRGIRSRWYLALAYEKDGNIKSSIAELDKILTADPKVVDPPDLARLQGRAKKMKARLQQGG